MLNIILFEPEIPENTGNISRNCVGFNIKLHMIKPYGFILNSKNVKRAGLDYWEKLSLTEYDNWDEFEKQNNISNLSKIYFFSKHGNNSILNINFINENINENVYVVFGKESKGIDKNILEKFKDKIFSIPMNHNVRSFNLSNCVAIVSYEYHRQNKFKFI